MININGALFAESNDEVLNSLFKPVNGQTVTNTAKRYKRQIKLFNMQSELIGVINKYGVICHARKLENGKTWFSYADIDEIGSLSSSETREIMESLSIDYTWQGIERVYQFK